MSGEKMILGIPPANQQTPPEACEARMSNGGVYFGVHQEASGAWRGECMVEEQTFKAPLQETALNAAIARDKILYKLRRPLAMQIGLSLEEKQWVDETPLISQQLVDTQTQGTASNCYRAVYWDAERMQWEVKIRVDGDIESFGHYADKEEAAKRYDWLILERDGRGAGCRVNHPENFLTWCHANNENPVLERETPSPEGIAASNSQLYAMLENLDLKKYFGT